MGNNWLLGGAVFFFVLLVIATLSRLTLQEAADPCDNPQADISGAALADTTGDQDALINRAIILKGNCEKQPKD